MNANDIQERPNGTMTATQTMESGEDENMEWREPAETREYVESEPSTWLSDEEIDQFQSNWNSIQTEFVDEPRTSVEHADALVAEALERIEQAFANKRTILDKQWTNQEDMSTEDLRIALQHYRSFLNRILEL